jgi:hypothetical protein
MIESGKRRMLQPVVYCSAHGLTSTLIHFPPSVLFLSLNVESSFFKHDFVQKAFKTHGASQTDSGKLKYAKTNRSGWGKLTDTQLERVQDA